MGTEERDGEKDELEEPEDEEEVDIKYPIRSYTITMATTSADLHVYAIASIMVHSSPCGYRYTCIYKAVYMSGSLVGDSLQPHVHGLCIHGYAWYTCTKVQKCNPKMQKSDMDPVLPEDTPLRAGQCRAAQCSDISRLAMPFPAMTTVP